MDSVSYTHLDVYKRQMLHSDGGPVVWGAGPHSECGAAFGDIAADPGNRVVIFTGAESEFIAREKISHPGVTAPVWERVFVHGQRLIYNHLEIRVPMIAAINGPATIHAELGLLCDIVLASDDAVFQEAPHYPEGLVPGVEMCISDRCTGFVGNVGVCKAGICAELGSQFLAALTIYVGDQREASRGNHHSRRRRAQTGSCAGDQKHLSLIHIYGVAICSVTKCMRRSTASHMNSR